MPLGLVSYGSSDSEGSDNEQEDEKQETPVSKTPNQKLEAVPITESGEISDEDDEVSDVITVHQTLPRSTHTTNRSERMPRSVDEINASQQTCSRMAGG